MKLSNSAVSSFLTCPKAYHLGYEVGLKAGGEPTYLQFGHRFHQSLQVHYGGGELPPTTLSPELEFEVQAMYEAYLSYYPQEPFDVVDCEKPFEVAIPGTPHTYIGRIDMLVRDKLSGKLQLFETKTESRYSKRNIPEAWLARNQGSFYVWAASQVYGEPISDIILNVATKGTERGNIGPAFRRDNLHRSPAQISEALTDLTWAAEAIAGLQDSRFPRNTNSCVSEKGYKCEYYSYCHLGSSEGLILIQPYAYLST